MFFPVTLIHVCVLLNLTKNFASISIFLDRISHLKHWFHISHKGEKTEWSSHLNICYYLISRNFINRETECIGVVRVIQRKSRYSVILSLHELRQTTSSLATNICCLLIPCSFLHSELGMWISTCQNWNITAAVPSPHGISLTHHW